MATPTGPIAWRARSEIPATWDALVLSSQYGEVSVNQRLDYIKYTLFATVSNQTDEESFYNPTQLLLAGKMLAMEVIPAGADYWADQAIGFSASARSSSENVSYPDRIASLWRVHARLLVESEKLKSQLGTSGISGIKPVRRMVAPKINTETPFRTAEPMTFPRQYTDWDGIPSTSRFIG